MESLTLTFAPSNGSSLNDGRTAWRGSAVWAAPARWRKSQGSLENAVSINHPYLQVSSILLNRIF